MLERSVEAGLRRQVEKRGGLCLKFTSPGCSGVPDRVIIAEGRVVFVELKQEDGRLRPMQKVMIRRMQRAGADVRVVYGAAGVRELMKELWPDEVHSP